MKIQQGSKLSKYRLTPALTIYWVFPILGKQTFSQYKPVKFM